MTAAAVLPGGIADVLRDRHTSMFKEKESCPDHWLSLHSGNPGADGRNEIAVERQPASLTEPITFGPMPEETLVTHVGVWEPNGSVWIRGAPLDVDKWAYPGDMAVFQI